MRLDRFLANLPELSRRDAQMLIASGRLRVDGQVVRDGTHEVRVFSRVELDEQLLQAGKPARYYMLHKPMGCVSATRDPQHPTVLDLFPEDLRDDLHIGGRLDYNTTGLMLLTNDGQWSRRLTLPGSRRDKVYYVETEAPIDQRYVDAFAAGLHFRFEDLVTLPAQLEPIGPRCARLTLHEGRYHQVKRMFGHFDNKVLRLHRERMGDICLDPQLPPGAWRPLNAEEICSV
ncbi:TPA: 16S rRNA pseudouridine(516) synthase [Pseudomonas aeruginosa]|nr:16S rRNA pseudouridine(516) synthase [Pseudomonas aeruginosa]HBO9760287.1 16S rRNA pseudouridine(516) synthase [Pseudomonas aeruginosa]